MPCCFALVGVRQRQYSAFRKWSAADLKTDRQNRKLLMQKWNWVGKGKARGGARLYKRRIEEELDRFERFQLAE